MLGTFTPSAQAVIAGGTYGNGSNNTDPADLQNYLSDTGYNDFANWNNLINVSNASGVYLGYNPLTNTGWVLSAAHITPKPTTLTIGGSSYNVSGQQIIGSTDLILYSFTLGSGINPPALPQIQLNTQALTGGEFTLMFGVGYTDSIDEPYAWGENGTAMRFGTNIIRAVETRDIEGIDTTYLITKFSAPGDVGDPPTGYEAQAAIGDSGGGLFVYRNGEWFLAGIGYAVGSSIQKFASYNDDSIYTDIHAHLSSINGITGVLIPEPSVLLLLVGAGFWMLRARYRSQ